jgi:hypothetical protein
MTFCFGLRRQTAANKACNAKSVRVSDLLCMSNLAHASKLKEHDDNDDIQGSIRRAAERS